MKIRYLIDTFLSPQIGALDWVGRYGGVVKTMYKEFEDQGEKFKTKRYPVASDVLAKDCDNLSVLQDLVPNDNYKSVVYWEELSPLTNVGYTQTKKFTEKKFKGTARLIVWLNLAKLGITNSKDGFLVIPSLEKILTVKGKIQGGVLAGAHLWIEPKQIVNQDINTVFGKYDYPKTINYYLGSEFDFCAIDVEFTLEQCLSNDTVLPVLPSVDCANGEPSTPCVPLPVTCQEKLDFIAPVRYTCFIPSLAFEVGNDTDFNALSPTQVSDLSTRICTPCPQPLDYSFNFLGISEYIKGQTGGVYNLDYNNAFSAFTFFTRNSATRMPLLAKLNGNTGYYFEIISNKLRLIFIGGAYLAGRCIDITTVNTVAVGSIVSCGFTYNGNGFASGMKLWINGVNEAFTIAVNGFNTFSMLNGANIEIGGVTTASLFADYKVNNCRMWNIELTPTNAAIEGLGTANKPNASPVNAANCIMDTDFDTSVFGLDTFAIMDDSGASVGFKTVNAPFSSRFIQP